MDVSNPKSFFVYSSVRNKLKEVIRNEASVR